MKNPQPHSSRRLAIVHPSASFRNGLAAAFPVDRWEVLPGEDLNELLENGPSVVVILANDPGTPILQRDKPETVVVFLVDSLRTEAYQSALAAGAHGVAHVNASPETIAHVVGAASKGETVLPTEVARQMAGRPRPKDLTLNDDELFLLQRLSEGATVVQLAEERFMAERTVRRHLQNIFLILGASSRAEAMKHASQLGLLT